MSTQVNQTRSSMSLLQASALAGAVALGSYAIYGLTKKSDFKIRIDKQGTQTTNTTPEDSEKVRARISSTYKYLLGSVATTAATSFALYKMGVAHAILHNPAPWMLASFMTSITTMLATRFTSYRDQFKTKHLFWTTFNMSIGASLSTIGYVGGSIVCQSLIYTAAVMSGISLVAVSAPSNYFLGLGSVLSVGLGLLNGFALIQWFYPKTDMSNLTIPLSLGVFGLFTAYDTQKVMHNAQDMSDGNEYDPINEQMELYLDSVNLFVDIVRLLIKLQEDEDKKKKKKKKSKN
eukprot:105496_1